MSIAGYYRHPTIHGDVIVFLSLTNRETWPFANEGGFWSEAVIGYRTVELRGQWNADGPDDYRFEVYRLCTCLENRVRYVVTVEGGQAREATRTTPHDSVTVAVIRSSKLTMSSGSPPAASSRWPNWAIFPPTLASAL